MLAAMYALAGNAGSTPADDIYTHTGNFYDVTSGNNGSCSPAYLCTAETGYDGPTGIGTPNGIAGLVARHRHRQHGDSDQPGQPDRHRRHGGLACRSPRPTRPPARR